MTKLALLAVLAATLTGACAPYAPYHAYGYHHAYWRHHGYWRRGYWNNGAYVDSYIYVNPDGTLPAGVTVPQTDANGNVIAPGMVAPNTAAAGVAVQPVQPTIAAPGTVQPVQPYPQPNTASGVAP